LLEHGQSQVYREDRLPYRRTMAQAVQGSLTDAGLLPFFDPNLTLAQAEQEFIVKKWCWLTLF